MADTDVVEEHSALLRARKSSSLETENPADVEGIRSRGSTPFIQEAWLQLAMGAPIAGMQVLSQGISLMTTAITGRHFDTNALAAVALSGTAYWSFCKMPMMGMAGALDTLSSQAVGAGRMDLVPEVFQKCLLFLSLHALPASGLLLCVPRLFQAMGQAPEVCALVSQYIPGMLGALWVDNLYRAINRTLMAQRITRPQLYVCAICTALHWPVAYLLMVRLGLGVAGAAWANAAAEFNQVWMLVLYIILDKRAATVWGSELKAGALKGWSKFAKLAYAAMFMDCSEAFTWGATAILAGILPNGAASAAAFSVTNQFYSLFFMMYMAAMMVATTRVGNALGAGDAWMARCSTCVVLAGHPFIWALGVVVFLLPATRHLIMATFTSGSDAVLERHIQHLLSISVVVLLPDGLQIAMAGVVQGMGRQQAGSMINIVGQLFVALPSAVILAFVLRFGVEGLLTGLMLGAMVQTISYIVLLYRMNWVTLAADVASSHQPIKSTAPEPA